MVNSEVIVGELPAKARMNRSAAGWIGCGESGQRVVIISWADDGRWTCSPPTFDVVKKGVHAGRLVGEVARVVGSRAAAGRTWRRPAKNRRARRGDGNAAGDAATRRLTAAGGRITPSPRFGERVGVRAAGKDPLTPYLSRSEASLRFAEEGGNELILAIIQPSKLEAVKEALNKVEVFRLTIIDVQGFGRQKGQTEVYRGHELTVNLLRKVQLQIAVNEDFVEPTVNAIMEAGRTGRIGMGRSSSCRWRIASASAGDAAQAI
jgi:nitrogen regulatory protein P-II 1